MAEPLTVARRFTRSVHIERDFDAAQQSLAHYLVTPLVQRAAGRVLSGLTTAPTERAFSLVGPYGAGKSAFGVFIAQLLQAAPAERRGLLRRLDAVPALQELPLDAGRLLAVTVPGHHRSLRTMITERLRAVVLPALDPLTQVIFSEELAQAGPTPDPGRTAELAMRAAELLQATTPYAGVLLVVDELGQYLQFAAQQDDERDLFVLQSLAEAAARSAATPLLVLTILHQAFERYSAASGQARRVEWAKVQGRFVDLPFREPAVQMIRLVARALTRHDTTRHDTTRHDTTRHDTTRHDTTRHDTLAARAQALGICAHDMPADEWPELVRAAQPLHPTVLLALPALFRRLAQNERSLFAFLQSDEPWSLTQFVRDGGTVYRLSHLLNYIESGLGAALYAGADGKRWAELAEAQAAVAAADALTQQVLATIGLITALDRSSGLRASRDVLAYALFDDDAAHGDALDGVLEQLQSRRLIVYRQHRDSYVLWEGSDLDIAALVQQRRTALRAGFSAAALLTRYADTTPRPAQQHSYRSGAARVFAVRYLEPAQLSQLSAPVQPELLFVTPADDEERRAAQQWATAAVRADEPLRVTVIPRRNRDLYDALIDVAALQQLLHEQPELAGDRAARREVAGRLADAEQYLREVLAAVYSVREADWYVDGAAVTLSGPAAVDALLSRACDRAYAQSPRIWNELINRRQLSSAAARARSELVAALRRHPDQPELGISGNGPDWAIYRSVLLAGRLHRQLDGVWRILPPDPADDPLQITPAWQALCTLLSAEHAEQHSLAALFEQLTVPPFGVKPGLAPLLFALIDAAYPGRLLIYERGVFVPLVDEAVYERLLTRPNRFSARLSLLSGARAALCARLMRGAAGGTAPTMVAALRPIVTTFRGLTAYSRQTADVGPAAAAVRTVLSDARAPEALLFEDLPRACGVAPFAPDEAADAVRVEAFVQALQEALRDLQRAHQRLLQRIEATVRQAFGLIGGRAELLTRVARLNERRVDARLRALQARLEFSDDGPAWLEATAALLARQTPAEWHDRSFDEFVAAAGQLGRHLQQQEELYRLLPPDQGSAEALRVVVQTAAGEQTRTLRHDHGDVRLQQLADRLRELLASADVTAEQRAALLGVVLAEMLTEEERTA